MALRVGKRKRPPREEKPFKQAAKIAERSLDDKTVDVIISLINTRVIKTLDYPLSGGKEAIVFRATTPSGKFVALKIFKFETSSFRNMMPYIEGDPRFEIDNVRHNLRGFIKTWARKEFANLQAAVRAGVLVPKPILLRDNVLVMDFLGVNGVPSALMEDVELANPEKTLDLILADVRKLYKAGFVHADLSSFNIIIHENAPFLIDFAQCVSLKHPRADEFLCKDLHNLLKYFDKLGVKRDLEKTLSTVKSA